MTVQHMKARGVFGENEMNYIILQTDPLYTIK